MAKREGYVVVDADRCKGLASGTAKIRVLSYLAMQQTKPYITMDEALSTFTGNPMLKELDIDNPQVEAMVFMALYNLAIAGITRQRVYAYLGAFLASLVALSFQVART